MKKTMNKQKQRQAPATRPQVMDAGVLDELRKWGGPAEMSSFEALMWLAEADPRLRSTTTSVLILDL
jgi:diacylglycerol O-acyltransferase